MPRYCESFIYHDLITKIVGELKRSFHKDHILVTSPIEFFKHPPWEDVTSESFLG